MEDQKINIIDRILKILSEVISYLLHPLLMPSLIFLLVFNFCPEAFNISPALKEKLLWMIFTTTFVFPFISTFVLFYVIKRNFSITELLMENKKERFYPFLFTGFFYGAVTYIFIKSGVHPNVIAVIGGISASVILVAVITLFWKISAHAVGICGALGYMIVISYYFPYEEMLYPIAVVAFLAGLLMSARLNLNAHTPSQVYFGGLLGFAMSILSFIFFKRYGLDFIY